MPYCPRCRCEFLESIKTCNDCGVDLVDELPPDEHEKEADVQTEWEKVLNVKADSEAEMYIELLESENIPAIKKSYNISFFPDSTHGVDILVPKELKDKAGGIISNLNNEKDISFDEVDELKEENDVEDLYPNNENNSDSTAIKFKTIAVSLLFIILLILIVSFLTQRNLIFY